MIYYRVDDRSRIIDILDTSDPHVIIGNPVGLVKTALEKVPNIQLLNDDLIPLYKWDGKNAVERTAEEVEADRSNSGGPDTPSDSASIWTELNRAYQEGVDSV